MFECLEVIGSIRLDFSTHPLAGPLFEAAKFFVDKHAVCLVLCSLYSVCDQEGSDGNTR